MAKLTMTFENKRIKKELSFKGEIFEYTMEPSVFGMKGNKPCMLSQYQEKFGAIDEEGELAQHLDNIDFGDEDDILEALEYLSNMED